MSVKQFTDFVKKITTETSDPARNSSVASAFEGIDKVGKGQNAVDVAAAKLAEVAKSQGFDVSEADVKEYFNYLKIEYEHNPMIAAIMDSHCSSTCHIGSAVGNR